jgi:sugar/nucleoside kinase (ribokinase family)
MFRYDLMIIGHVTSDFLTVKGRTTGFIGGGAYFSAFAARRSGMKLCVVTKLAPGDFGILEGLKKDGIEVIALESGQTTSIANIFETDDVDHRKVQLLSQADPFRPGDIPEAEVGVYSLSGLFVDELPDALIAHLAKKGRIALDLQAKLRWSEAGTFAFRDWPGKKEHLPLVTYLKADNLEAEVAAGTPDRDEAARLFHGWGAKEVMVTCAEEVILYDGQRIYRAPFDPENLSGRTGRGDTCFVSYVSWRQHHGIEESLNYAAALTSLKMETPGPFLGAREAVLARMARTRR